MGHNPGQRSHLDSGGSEDLGQRHSDKDGQNTSFLGLIQVLGFFSYSNDGLKDIRFKVESNPSRKGETAACP